MATVRLTNNRGSVVVVPEEKADGLVLHHGYKRVDSKPAAKKTTVKKSSSSKSKK